MAHSTLALFSLLLLFLLPEATESQNNEERKYLQNKKVPYFSTVSMLCDHPQLNITDDIDVNRISWVFPDGTNVHSDRDVDPKLYTFSELETETATAASLKLYNLTALEIDENQFGYFLCVVEFYDTTDKPPAVIRWGLNVNGADFSSLLKEYRENAIVGGAAAAALLLVIGGGCLFWNMRHGNRDSRDADGDDEEGEKVGGYSVAGAHENNERKFNNAAFKGDDGDHAVVDVHM